MWRGLSDAEWRQHSLNKFRGWLLVIIIVNCLGFLLVPLSLWLLIADLGPELSVATPGRPLSAEVFSLSVGTIGGVLCLYAIWTRRFRAPEIYMVTSLIAWVVAIGVEVIWNDPDLSFLEYMLGYAIAAALFLVAPVLYLFLGGRPNVMFKRRVRISS